MAEMIGEIERAQGMAATASAQVTTMEEDKKAFFDQQLPNELERTRKTNKRNDELTASSSSSPPEPTPPPPDAGKVKKQKVTLPINHPAQNTPSQQPTGIQLPRPHRATMPDSGMPMPCQSSSDGQWHKRG